MDIKEKDNLIILSRMFNAPKELVFSAFQNPLITKWWGPQEWPVDVSIMDFTPGGKWHYSMVGPESQEAWSIAKFEEIDKPNRIIFHDGFSDAGGNLDETLPQTHTILTFEEQSGETTLTSCSELASEKERKKLVEMGLIEGLKDT